METNEGSDGERGAREGSAGSMASVGGRNPRSPFPPLFFCLSLSLLKSNYCTSVFKLQCYGGGHLKQTLYMYPGFFAVLAAGTLSWKNRTSNHSTLSKIPAPIPVTDATSTVYQGVLHRHRGVRSTVSVNLRWLLLTDPQAAATHGLLECQIATWIHRRLFVCHQ